MALTDTAVTTNQVAAASGVATSTTSFSPGAGSMVIIMASWLFGTNATGVTWTCKDSNSVSYTSAVQHQDWAGVGGAMIFYHVYAAAPGSVHVTVTCSNTGAADCQVSPRVITGQAASPVGPNTIAFNSLSGSNLTADTASLTTTANGSRVYLAGDWSGTFAATAAANTTIISTWNDGAQGDTGVSGLATSSTGTPGATTFGFTSATATAVCLAGIEVLPAATAVSAAANLSGTGSLTVSPLVTQPAAANLSGSGTVTAGPAVSILPAAALIGEAFLTAGATVTAPGAGSANLSGTGALAVARQVTYQQAVPLSGWGTLSAQYTGLMLQSVPLSGTGALAVAAAAALRFTAGLFGAGYLSVPQVAGGLVNGIGGAGTPQALPGSSQVAVAPPGSGNWQWLGTLGHVTALTYSFVCPGGADKMTCTIMVPASYRTQLFNPGWQVKITRGGHQVWAGKLDEPQPSPSGWTLTAVGNGNRGTDYLAVYPGTWPAGQPDAAVNAAITRGLPWVNPGIGTPAGIWLGQSVDSGAQTVTALLNLVTSRGGLTWYVNSQPGGLYGGDDLSVFPLPAVPNRLLVATTPVARTLGGDINTIVIRYQVTADNTTTSTAATYSTVTAVNAQSVAAHGTLEAYIDISDAGTLTSAAAQAVGAGALQLYQRASFAGPFQASYGQLLNTGGAPIDPGTDQSATMVRMLLYDYGLGGEVGAGPVTWITGAYEWDDFKMVATLTPMQVLDASLSSLLSAGHAALMPVTVASA